MPDGEVPARPSGKFPFIMAAEAWREHGAASHGICREF